MIINTPAGYVVECKDDLSYGEYIQLQKQMVASAEFTGAGLQHINAGSVLEVNQKALEILVQKVIMPDGKVAENPVGAIMDMPREDGLMVEKKIDSMSKLQGLSKKKGS
jgi:hypothetical protein